MSTNPSIAIIGAGIGGLALAGLLSRQGADVTVYEQAKAFQRIGAGIQMSPNAMRVLRALGLEPHLRQRAFAPRGWMHRVWDSGEYMSELTFTAEDEKRYGAPYLLLHRGDLHAALHSAVPTELIAFDKKLVGLERSGGGVALAFADGSRVAADAVIGADGVHSLVRAFLLGPERPKFTGRVAHRTTFPASLLQGFEIDTCTKWWGPDRHIVVYPVDARRQEIYFVTSVPDPGWDVESWSTRGEMEEVRRALAGFHGDVQRVLAASPSVHKWAPVRARSPAEVGGRAGRPARRRLPPDDALHGAGRGQCAGGRRGPVALPRRDRRRRRSLPLLPGDPAGADRAGPAHVAAEHLGQAGGRPVLGLRLRRLANAAGPLVAAGRRLTAIHVARSRRAVR